MNSKFLICKFMAEHVNDLITDDDDIFAQGLVSSMFVIQLVSFIEESFDIHVGGEDLVFENFRTIENIVSLVERLKAEGP